MPRTNVSRLVFHRHARLQFHAVRLGISLNVASAIACSASTHAACTTRVEPRWRLLCIRDEVGPNAFIEHVSMLAFKILECKLVTVSHARQGTTSDKVSVMTYAQHCFWEHLRVFSSNEGQLGQFPLSTRPFQSL